MKNTCDSKCSRACCPRSDERAGRRCIPVRHRSWLDASGLSAQGNQAGGRAASHQLAPPCGRTKETSKSRFALHDRSLAVGGWGSAPLDLPTNAASSLRYPAAGGHELWLGAMPSCSFTLRTFTRIDPQNPPKITHTLWRRPELLSQLNLRIYSHSRALLHSFICRHYRREHISQQCGSFCSLYRHRVVFTFRGYRPFSEGFPPGATPSPHRFILGPVRWA
jgi:hypothetical protein